MICINVMTQQIRKSLGSKRSYERHKDSCKDRAKQWAATNPDKIVAIHKRSALRRKNSLQRYRRDRRYGSGAGIHFEGRLTSQNNRCDICGGLLRLGKDTHQDHNHVTGQLRSALCSPCNKALGYFEDEVFRELATAYLRKWGATC